MGMTWEEEMKVIYDSPKIRLRRIHFGNVGLRSVKIVLSTWPFLKVVSQLGNGHGPRDEGGREQISSRVVTSTLNASQLTL